jgi:hypothetical protein
VYRDAGALKATTPASAAMTISNEMIRFMMVLLRIFGNEPTRLR